MSEPAKSFKTEVLTGRSTIDEVISYLLKEQSDQYKMIDGQLIKFIRSPLGLLKYKVSIAKSDGTDGFKLYFLYELIK